MRKMKNSKGFTLMEMLIVVAIIAILIAIAIPVMTTNLEKAREATDLANIRSAYAEATVNALTSDTGTGEATTEAFTQTTAGFDSSLTIPDYLETENWNTVVETATKGKKIKVSVDQDGKVTYEEYSDS